MKQSHKNQRLGAVLTVLTVVAALIVVGISYSQNSSTQAGNTGMTNRPMLSVSSLGNQTTISGAERVLGVTINPPTNLLSGMALASVRVSTNTASLVYFDSKIQQIPFYDNASMIILIMNDGTSPSSSVPSSSPTEYVAQGGVNTTASVSVYSTTNPAIPLTISGHPGWGTNQVSWDVARVNWWANGLHYEIFANLPLNTLIAIANSMGT